MQRGISYQGFLPLRKEASDQSEMLTQLLFGESFTIIEAEGPWARIEMDSDGFVGWVPRNSFPAENAADKHGNRPVTGEMIVIHPSVSILDTQNARQLLLPAGSVLKNSAFELNTMEEARFKKLSDEGLIIPSGKNDPEAIGKMLLSIPALHGGRCGFGFDAPGLVQMLCRAMGISLPHSISGQAESGTIINFIHETQKGNLAFFHDGEDQFTHVGMVLDEGKIIHVSDQVRIDKLDQQGIYCIEKQGYTHQLSIVKSVKSLKS